MQVGPITVDVILNQTEYKRPATPVRVRPYIFLYESRIITLSETNLSAFFGPEGNVSAGNRVTWGWKIKVIKTNANAVTVQFMGSPLVIPAGMFEYELIDSTKNAQGIDKNTYQVASTSGTFQIHAVEQIMLVNPL